jgi:DNA primase
LAKDNPELVKKAVDNSREAMEYFFEKKLSENDKNRIEGKNKIGDEVLEMIASLSNEIAKSHWLKKLAQVLEIKESILTDMLKKVSIRSTINTSGGSVKSEETFSPKSKKETLTQEIIGFMLVYENIWKKAFTEKKEELFLLKNNLLDFMLKNGENLGFSFDNLLKSLESVEDKARVDKIFFEKKYRFGLNNNIEEIIIENPENEFEKILAEIKKEEKKEELEKIQQDLRLAEEREDREATIFLRQEASRILGEINK